MPLLLSPLVSCPFICMQLSSNRNLDLDTSLNVDNNLLDNLGGSVETVCLLASSQQPRSRYSLNQTLVDSHLESIPCLRSFTTRSLAGSDLQGLGWQSNWALNTEILGLGTLDEFLADFLEGSNLAAGQSDSDLVGFLLLKY